MKKTILTLIALVSLQAANSQTVTTFAGKPGVAGWDPTSYTEVPDAVFTSPFGIVVDAYDRLYIAEHETHRIRVVDPGFSPIRVYHKTGKATDPSSGFGYANQSGNQARYDSPRGMTIGLDGYVYVCDFNNNCIRKMNGLGTNIGTSQVVSTFAGEGETFTPEGGSHVDGTGLDARFNGPVDICMDANGNFYVADNYNECIRKITPNGVVTTLAGAPGMTGDVDGTGNAARFNNILAVDILDADHIIVADAWNNKIRKVNIHTGEVTTLAGNGNTGNEDGNAADAEFNGPAGLAVDGFGNVYVSEDNGGQSNIIRRISNGQVTTICGTYQDPTQHQDGQGSDARFYMPGHMAFNTAKNVLYVCDMGNHVIRAINLKPIARFFASPTATNIGVPVQLTNESFNNPVSYTWQLTPNTGFTWENGTSATSEEPVLKFSQTGAYTVKLIVTNTYGSSDTTRNNYLNISNITTNDPPVADFVADDSTIVVGGIVAFTDLSSNQPNQWSWTVVPSSFQYVNSTASNSQNPQIQFTAVGNYTIILEATNTNGSNTKPKANYIQVGPLGLKNLALADVMEVYPNPSTGSFQLRMKDNMVAVGLEAQLYDFSGKCIDTRVLESNGLSYNGLASGVYFLKVNDGETSYTQKVVVR